MDNLIITNKPRSFQNSCTFKTGLSDFHKMTLTVLKSHFEKQKQRVLNTKTTNFSATFSLEIKYKINWRSQICNCDKDLKPFKETCLPVLNTVDTCSIENQVYTSKSATFHIQGNSIARSKLRKKFLKSGSVSDKKANNKKRNKCVSLLGKTKNAYYLNLKFWKKVKSFFSDKSNNFQNISLIENGKLLTDGF